MTKIILASQSKGRKNLLSLLKIPFQTVPSFLDEDKIIASTPLQTIILRAKLKGEDIFQKIQNPNDKPPPTIILSADSGAIIGNSLIGKPKDYDDAIRILKILSSASHSLVTAVYMIKINYKHKEIFQFVDDSIVTFYNLKNSEIKTYLSLTDFTRFAGGYALFDENFYHFPNLTDLLSQASYLDLLDKYQKRNPNNESSLPNLIAKIEGSISNVIGLPLEKIIPVLQKYDIPLA